MPEILYQRPKLYAKQEAALFNPKRWGLIEATTKAGKSQPLHSTVWTSYGPVTMSQLRVGGEVLGVDGKPKKILGIYPQGLREVYVIEFVDGTQVEADGEHLWEIHEYGIGARHFSTLELMQWKSTRLERAWTPNTAPVEFEPCVVPLDPYLVGLLIGDGALTTEVTRFSSKDQEIVNSFQELLPAGHELVKEPGDNSDWRVTARKNAAQMREDGTHLGTITRKLYLRKPSYEKSIPVDYIFNSIEVRRAVIQGIFDTDGSVDKHGQPILEQTSLDLALQINMIIQSLGGYVRTRVKYNSGYRDKNKQFIPGRPVFRQRIILKDSTWCFRLERKKNLVRRKIKDGNRRIKRIYFSCVAECQCIEIDDSRHLYLTEGFIATHNTVGCIAWQIEQAMYSDEGTQHVWVAPIASQAAIAFQRLKRGLPTGTFTAKETPTPKIDLANGNTIWCKSGDNPDSIYGEDYGSAVIDEASRCKAEVWYAVRSTLTATSGPARIIGNVKGKKNWFYEWSRRAEKGEDPNAHYARLTVVDAIEAGIIPEGEVADARLNMPEHVFNELYMAIPSADSGNPFGEDYIYKCAGFPLAPGPVAAYGIDLAKKFDYLVIIGLNKAGAVSAFHRWQGKSWKESIALIHEIIGEDVPTLVDSTGLGDPIVEELQIAHGNVRGFNFSSTSKQKLMEGLAVSIQRGEITFPDGPIKSELLNFEFKIMPTGKAVYQAPEGYHDDCVCALALAREIWSTSQPGANIMEFLERSYSPRTERSEAPAEGGPAKRNELDELYRTTFDRFRTAERGCKFCNLPILGPARVSDGANVWHTGCV